MTDDLTNPLETIVSILKNATTGLGTTGYEIYEDDGSNSCSLLVTYKLAKEKLTSLFGGSQDYDVILTVEPGEAEDNWIGFSVKEWREQIIIKIHVIEKHSAVGTGNKVITPELVRYKAVNALRKFIKAKVNAPGGSVKIWTAQTYTPSEDASVRPIMYISTVVTETWSYYNPTCVSGEQVQDSGFESASLLPYWITSGGEISTTEKHAGSYSAYLNAVNEYIEQTVLDIEVDCMSAATIWLLGTNLIDEDFENYNDVGWTKVENGSGTCTVPSAAAARAGSYGMRSDVPASGGRHSGALEKSFTNTNNDVVYVDFWIRVNSHTLSSDDATLLFFTITDSIYGLFELVESGSSIYLKFTDYQGNNYTHSEAPLTVGQWHHIILGYKLHSTEGVLYLELDDEVLENQTGIGTDWDDSNKVSQIYLGVDNVYTSGSYAVQVDYDDVNVYFAYGEVTVKVTYSDASITSITGITSTGSWAATSILAELTSGKTVNEIRVTLDSGTDAYIDDVSITGSGA